MFLLRQKNTVLFYCLPFICWTECFLIYMTFFTHAESPLPRRASQAVDTKPKVKQPSPKEKKPSLPDIKPKIEMLPKKELEGFKIEPKEEVEEDVKLKQVFSVSDVEKGDLVELAAKNKLLLGMISQLKEQIVEKDNEMNERDNQIVEKDEKIAEKDEKIEEMYKQIADKDHQIADKDQQMAKLAEQIAEKDQQILEQVKQIAVKDEQTVKYQQMYEGLMQGKTTCNSVNFSCYFNINSNTLYAVDSTS